ncbi:F-box/WD repeat-containing protein 5 isoform X3 [Lontra canadensis]|uniref:F-box/WD repeat-containing protein 5 isoform X3 n=2 Tax=Lontra canadensis TaxID=76717 RepID=UPI0013F2F623|nr:F-box/WD repeat-containing protein 5 isoform X3 [Lontra canadensis]XP_032706839.1 F-box/WD repeat-containing protein 5 isoform X3 [Lontra canadensis]
MPLPAARGAAGRELECAQAQQQPRRAAGCSALCGHRCLRARGVSLAGFIIETRRQERRGGSGSAGRGRAPGQGQHSRAEAAARPRPGTKSFGGSMTRCPAWRSRRSGSTRTRFCTSASPTRATSSPPAPRTAPSSVDMRPYNWSYTQFSQFNRDDSLLLASGVFLGPHNSSSGEIAVISLDNFALLSRVRNKPYDVFGCWLTETSLISGNLHRIGDITSCSVLWLNNAFQDVESENVNVVKRLFKIQNLNASTIRTVMVADCSRFDSPDLLLDAGASPGRVFDLGSDSEDEAGGPGPGPAPARTKEGLRRFLDGLLDGRAQPQLSEHALETKVAELLAQGRTKPPEHSMANAHKLLIFTTGCLTYSPHQIGIKQILPHQMTTAGPVLGEGRGSDAFFDALDHVIDVHGHIIGMGLSPDNRYLYVNSRAWPSGSVVADPMQPPPIAEEIDLLVFDLKTMREVKRALRAHRAYTPNDECFFIFLDVSRDFVASGAEDRHGYIWDRHYNICLAKLRHQDVVNSVVFSPREQELLLTASDDATIKAWRSPRTVRIHQAPRPRPYPFISWFGSQRR